MRRLYLLGLIVCTACGSTGTTPGSGSGRRDQSISDGAASIQLTHEDYTLGVDFDVPRERVWSALLAAHDSLGIPVDGRDPSAFTVSYFKQVFDHTIAGKPASNYVDCGAGATGPRADNGDYRLRLNIAEKVTQPMGGKTTLHTTLQITAHSTSVSGSELECSSTGKLEERIAKMVTARLAT